MVAVARQVIGNILFHHHDCRGGESEDTGKELTA
jgi:hypothetical protein